MRSNRIDLRNPNKDIRRKRKVPFSAPAVSVAVITPFNLSTSVPKMEPYPYICDGAHSSGFSGRIDEALCEWGCVTATPYTITDPTPIAHPPKFDYRCIRHGQKHMAAGWMLPAGSHTIKLKLTDKTGAEYNTTANETVVANTRSVRYCTIAGNDANDGLTTLTGWATFDKVWTNKANTLEIRLERGGTYTYSGPKTAGALQNFYVKDFGSGNKPRIHYIGTNNSEICFRYASGGSAENCVWENVRFTTNKPIWTDTAHGNCMCFWLQNGNKNIAWINCEWDDTLGFCINGTSTGSEASGTILINPLMEHAWSQLWKPGRYYHIGIGGYLGESRNEVSFRTVGGMDYSALTCMKINMTLGDTFSPALGTGQPNLKEAARFQKCHYAGAYRCYFLVGPTNISFQDQDSANVRMDSVYMTAGSPGDTCDINKGGADITITNCILYHDLYYRHPVGTRESSPVSANPYGALTLFHNTVIADYVQTSVGTEMLFTGTTGNITPIIHCANLYCAQASFTGKAMQIGVDADVTDSSNNVYCDHSQTNFFRTNGIDRTFAYWTGLAGRTNENKESTGIVTNAADLTPTTTKATTKITSYQKYDYRNNLRGSTSYPGAVTQYDTTAPVVASVTILPDGVTWVFTFTEAGFPPIYPATVMDLAATGVTGFTPKIGGVAKSFTSLSITNLTMTAVCNTTAFTGQTCTYDYSSSTGNIADNANPANAMATVTGGSTTNGSTQTGAADTTAPYINSVVVQPDGVSLNWGFIEDGSAPVLPASSVNGFTLKVNTVTRTMTGITTSGTTGSATASSVIYSTDTVTLSYSEPSGNVTDSATVPNRMASFTNMAVTNGSAIASDTTPPTMGTPVVATNGLTITATFSENCLPSSGAIAFTFKVNGLARGLTNINITGTAWFANIASVVNSTDTCTLDYSPGNVTDAATPANSMAAFTAHAVTNNSTVVVDTTPPTLGTLAIAANGISLTGVYTEAGSPPVLPDYGSTGYVFKVNGVAQTISGIENDGTVFRATIAVAVLSTDTCTLSYTPGNVTDNAPSPNAMLAFSNRAITNNSTLTSDSTAPTFVSAAVEEGGDSIIITLLEAGSAPVLPDVAVTGFRVYADAQPVPVFAVTRSGNTEYTIALNNLIASGQTVKLDYIPGNVTDSATPTANAMAAFSQQSVTNGSALAFAATASANGIINRLVAFAHLDQFKP